MHGLTVMQARRPSVDSVRELRGSWSASVGLPAIPGVLWLVEASAPSLLHLHMAFSLGMLSLNTPPFIRIPVRLD